LFSYSWCCWMLLMCSSISACQWECWCSWFWMSCCVSSIVVSLCRGGGAPSAAHDSPWAGHGNHRQRRTYVFPDGCWRLLHMAIIDSSQSCHLAIAHLALMPGALGMLRSGLLPISMLRLVHVERFPTSMLKLVHAGRSRLVCIAGEGRSL
jgi:hypothetical protein